LRNRTHPLLVFAKPLLSGKHLLPCFAKHSLNDSHFFFCFFCFLPGFPAFSTVKSSRGRKIEAINSFF